MFALLGGVKAPFLFGVLLNKPLGRKMHRFVRLTGRTFGFIAQFWSPDKPTPIVGFKARPVSPRRASSGAALIWLLSGMVAFLSLISN